VFRHLVVRVGEEEANVAADVDLRAVGRQRLSFDGPEVRARLDLGVVCVIERHRRVVDAEVVSLHPLPDEGGKLVAPGADEHAEVANLHVQVKVESGAVGVVAEETKSFGRHLEIGG